MIGSFSITSCSGDVEPLDSAVIVNPDPTDPTDPTNPGTTTGSFKVDFSGQTYVALATTALVSDGNIIITGIRGTQGENIGIAIGGDQVGTYDGDDALMVYNPSVTSDYDYANLDGVSEESVSNGTVVITEINETTHMITGTFNFVGHWSDYTDDTPPAPIAFTNGTFTVPYTSMSTSTDIFTAKVDGIDLDPTLISASYVSVGGQDWIGVGGSTSALGTVSVGFKDTITPGTYTITGNPITDGVQGGYVVEEVSNVASAGTITILSITDSHVKGTFQFTAGTHVITAGVFDMDY